MISWHQIGVESWAVVSKIVQGDWDLPKFLTERLGVFLLHTVTCCSDMMEFIEKPWLGFFGLGQ